MSQLPLRAPQFTVDVFPQPRDVRLARWIRLQKLLLQTHSTQRQTHHALNASVVRERHLAAPAAEVDHHAAPARSRLMRHHPQVNQSPFLEPRYNLDIPSR